MNAIATELSKYENKEGQVNESLQRWEKELDKSVQEAQTGAVRTGRFEVSYEDAR